MNKKIEEIRQLMNAYTTIRAKRRIEYARSASAAASISLSSRRKTKRGYIKSLSRRRLFTRGRASTVKWKWPASPALWGHTTRGHPRQPRSLEKPKLQLEFLAERGIERGRDREWRREMTSVIADVEIGEEEERERRDRDDVAPPNLPSANRAHRCTLCNWRCLQIGRGESALALLTRYLLCSRDRRRRDARISIFSAANETAAGAFRIFDVNPESWRNEGRGGGKCCRVHSSKQRSFTSLRWRRLKRATSSSWRSCEMPEIPMITAYCASVDFDIERRLPAIASL